jgi:putative glycosyltransferase
MKLSVVTTLYKTSEFIEEFVRRVTVEALKVTDDLEIILVDDGSPDNSLEIAVKLTERDKHLKVIELSRNFGHHKAMMTGLMHAQGDLVFLIDSDLEEPPELFGEFYSKMNEGDWDVVYGYQSDRKGKWFERNSGRLVWWFFNKLLPFKIPHNNHCTVRLMTKRYNDSLVMHKEHKTAIGGLWILAGFRQLGVEITKGLRPKSSYSFSHRLIMLLDSVTSFSEVPLYFVFYLGLIILFCSGIFGLYLIFLKLSGQVLSGWISTMASIWFLGGLAIFSIGIVGLYISRIFIETKNRPYTIIRNIYNKY